MDKQALVRSVGAGLSTRALAEKFDCSQTNIRHWLGKYGLKTKPVVSSGNCVLCGKSSKQDSLRRRCQSCNTKIRRYRVRLAAVKLLGGECQHCGWSGPVVGFDFHHKNGDKEFAISSVANRSWEVVRRELRKCALLCATCHRIVHTSYDDEKLQAEIETYNGRVLDIGT